MIKNVDIEDCSSEECSRKHYELFDAFTAEEKDVYNSLDFKALEEVPLEEFAKGAENLNRILERDGITEKIADALYWLTAEWMIIDGLIDCMN